MSKKEIVINTNHEGLSLSCKAVKLLAKKKGFENIYFYAGTDYRDEDYHLYRRIDDPYNHYPTLCSTKDYGRVVSKLSTFAKCGFDYEETERDDPDLIQVVKELGSEVNAKYSDIIIVEIPENVDWTIDSINDCEVVNEKHRTWN